MKWLIVYNSILISFLAGMIVGVLPPIRESDALWLSVPIAAIVVLAAAYVAHKATKLEPPRAEKESEK